MSRKAVVCGAGGFIGNHLVKRLKNEGYWVLGIDLKHNEFEASAADEFVIGDLQDANLCKQHITKDIDEVYQLAADMGGAGYIFTGENDANVMHNSALVNLNVAHIAAKNKISKVFYSSSACMYPAYNQEDPDNPKCSEDSAYPAAPDSEYGWEKLFSERLYLSFYRNYGLDVRIARFHNIFGPIGTYEGGKEKAPAALCRKVALAKDGDQIDVWGDGLQTRSFLYIDECIDGIMRLMASDCLEPLNVGSEEMVSINDFAKMIIGLSGKNLSINNIPGPEGVRGRNSDNDMIEKEIGWKPNAPLIQGLEKTYEWISKQVLQKVTV